MLRQDEVPSLHLPQLPTRVSLPRPRRTVVRHSLRVSDPDVESHNKTCDTGVNTDISLHELTTEIESLRLQVKHLQKENAK